VGFTLQSVSPPQSRTPFDAMTLMPFLTSHSSALRTRRSRCPAASGLCSLQGSVSGPGPKTRWTDALMGFVRLSRAFPHAPWNRLPGSFPPVLQTCALREIARPALQGLDESVGEENPRGFSHSLEVSHQDLPSGSPDDSGVLSDGSERIWSHPAMPTGSEEPTRLPRKTPGLVPKNAPGDDRTPKGPGF
jgi:hypothetical protein